MNINSWASALTDKTLELADTFSTTQTGTGVDCSEMTGQVAVILTASNQSGTTPTLDVKLQTSATVGGTYADISGATFTQVTTTDGQEVIVLDIDSIATDFVRAVGTLAGTSPVYEYSVSMVGFSKYPA